MVYGQRFTIYEIPFIRTILESAYPHPCKGKKIDLLFMSRFIYLGKAYMISDISMVNTYWMAKDSLEVTGWVLLSRLTFARERLGETQLSRVLKDLPQEMHTLWESPDINAWYDIRTLEPFENKVALAIKPHDVEFVFIDMGRFSAELAFDPDQGHYHRFLGRAPELFLRMAAKWQNEYYSSGLTEYYPTGVSSCMIRIRYIPYTTRPNCLSNMGFFQRSIEILGGHNVGAKERTCVAWNDPACEFHFQWE